MTPPTKRDRDTRRINLADTWEELGRVRAAFEEYFADSTDEFKAAATMAGLELAENVIKHGTGASSGCVAVAVREGEVVISTQNQVTSTQRASLVRARIQEIADKGAREMYVKRMLELIEQPDAHGSGLGLFRIAYEGDFRLSCEILGDRLCIYARRRLDDALPN
ncbi:MAG TPA: DUF6272 family protein [Polyangiaceae bacterium]